MPSGTWHQLSIVAIYTCVLPARYLDSELGGHIIYFIGVFRCLPQAAVKSTVPNLPDGTNYHPDQKLLDLALQLKKAKERQMQASLKPLVCPWVPTVYYIYSLFLRIYIYIYICSTLKVTTMIVMLDILCISKVISPNGDCREAGPGFAKCQGSTA